MTIRQPAPLLPVPSGELRICELPMSSDANGDLAVPTRPICFSLVIPTYNEGKNVKEIVHLLSQLLDEAIPDAYELIVVDDNSPDRTWEIAQALTKYYPPLRVMRRVEERGLSTAVIRG
ncbi:MAG: hypothetical protein NVS2B14_09020 [Chamaesiphon sp.]